MNKNKESKIREMIVQKLSDYLCPSQIDFTTDCEECWKIAIKDAKKIEFKFEESE